MVSPSGSVVGSNIPQPVRIFTFFFVRSSDVSLEEESSQRTVVVVMMMVSGLKSFRKRECWLCLFEMLKMTQIMCQKEKECVFGQLYDLVWERVRQYDKNKNKRRCEKTTYRISEWDTLLLYVEIWMSLMQMQWLNEMDHVLNYVLSLICLSLNWRSYRPNIFRRPNTSF